MTMSEKAMTRDTGSFTDDHFDPGLLSPATRGSPAFRMTQRPAVIVAALVTLAAIFMLIGNQTATTSTPAVPAACTRAALLAEQNELAWQVRDQRHVEAEQAALRHATASEFRQMLAGVPAAPGVVDLAVCR